MYKGGVVECGNSDMLGLREFLLCFIIFSDCLKCLLWLLKLILNNGYLMGLFLLVILSIRWLLFSCCIVVVVFLISYGCLRGKIMVVVFNRILFVIFVK